MASFGTWNINFGAGLLQIKTSIQKSTPSILKFIYPALKPYQELFIWIKIERVMIIQSWDIARHFWPARQGKGVPACSFFNKHLVCMFLQCSWSNYSMMQASNEKVFNMTFVNCHLLYNFDVEIFFHLINHLRDIWVQSWLLKAKIS